jgi:hypothetical protein
MEYLSLYDYLGKAAGNELGKEVAAAATQAGIRLETREIDNPKYTGIVYLYPKDFLEFYFRDPETYQIEDTFPLSNNDILTDDELPF